MSENFLPDRALGKRVENAIVASFQNRGFQAWLNPAEDLAGKEAGDVFVTLPEGERLFEVKFDCESLWTGNFCVEGKTLEHTMADYLVVVEPHAWIIPMEEARRLYAGHPKKLMGDYKEPGALIRCQDFRKLESVKPLWKFQKELANH